MSEKISLKEAEHKVFSAATQDGLLDVFIGCVALQFAIAPLLSPSLGDFWSSAVFVPFWVLVAGGLWLFRRRVVKPRLGGVRFGAARKARLIRFNVVMLVVNVIAMAIGTWISLNSEVMSGRVTSAFFGLTCLVLFSTAAVFLHYPRLYVYGLLLGLSPLVGEWLFENWGASHHGFPITFGLTAGIMIATGLLVLMRLLRNNPVPGDGPVVGRG